MHYSVFVLHSLFASETRVLGAHKASLKVLQGLQVLASKLFFLNCSIKKKQFRKNDLEFLNFAVLLNLFCFCFFYFGFCVLFEFIYLFFRSYYLLLGFIT